MNPANLPALLTPGEVIQPMPGLKMTLLERSGFVRVSVHYSVLKERRPPGWAKAAAARYGVRGVRSYKWLREMEIDYEAASNEPIFANWDTAVHRIKPFAIPAKWPRWLMYDVGGTNPHALTWITMDPSPPDYSVYIYREWYRGIEMPDGAPGQYFASTDVIRVAYEHSLDKDGTPEKLQVLVVDPQAKATSAKKGDKPNQRAATIYEEICEMVDDLGWQVDVATGNNLKDKAIEDVIDRLGNYPMYVFHGDDVVTDELGEPVIDTDPETGAPKIVKPRLFVFSTCPYVCLEMPRYRWKDHASDKTAAQANRPEEPVDKDDHHITNLLRFMNWVRDDPALGEAAEQETPAAADAGSEAARVWRKRIKKRYPSDDQT